MLFVYKEILYKDLQFIQPYLLYVLKLWELYNKTVTRGLVYVVVLTGVITYV